MASKKFNKFQQSLFARSARMMSHELRVNRTYYEARKPKKYKRTCEIHGKLKIWGNIDNPLPLNKFGEVLKRAGYQQRRLHAGKRGYLVQEVDYQATRNAMEVDEIVKGDRGDTTF